MTRPLEMRFAPASVGGDGNVLTGLAAPFGVETRATGRPERIERGAFAATIADGHDILLLVDHSPSRVLARTRNGSLALEERSDGLWVTATLPDTPTAAEVRGLAAAGTLGGMSIGFAPVEEAIVRGVRVLRRVALAEVSVIASVPAYPTHAQMRAATPRLARLRRFMETL